MSLAYPRLPPELFTVQAVRRLETEFIKAGTPGAELMRRAADSALEALLERWPQTKRLSVFVGAGNNAGDGYCLANLAHQRGLFVQLVCVGDPETLTGDAADAAAAAFELGIAQTTELPISRIHEVWVDALLGIGLSREVEGDFLRTIEWLNLCKAPILALDCPSGLCTDTGSERGKAVRADLTVTFIALKRGLLTGQGPSCVGDLLLDDLGLPPAILAKAPAEVWRYDWHSHFSLPAREASSHKGSHGHVVVIGGDYGFGGAALLAAEAALHCGAGLVSVITRSANRSGMLARCPELMVLGTEDDEFAVSRIDALLERATAVVVGPGLGRGQWGSALWRRLRAGLRADSKVLVDADALYFLADEEQINKSSKQQWVLTPHPGEAAMMLGESVATVQADRFASVQALHKRYGASALLKGAGSLLCIGQDHQFMQKHHVRNLLCTEGNPGMATGGMGDVLAGTVGALMAQGLSGPFGLEFGVALHGEAGDLAAQRCGQRGLRASDLMPELRRLLNPLEAPGSAPEL